MMRRLTVVLAIGLVLAGCGSVPTIAPAAQATPAPTLDPAGEWSGVITFGTAYDPETLLIPKPLATFKRTVKVIAWSAQLHESAGATTIDLVLASVAKSGAESIVQRTTEDLSSPDFDLVANKADLAGWAGNKAGTYVLRYIREGDVLAEGTFALVK